MHDPATLGLVSRGGMPLPLPGDAKPVGTPATKPRAPSLIAEALRALAERNLALGLTVQGTACGAAISTGGRLDRST
jgi:hypothetical protein